MAAPQYHGGLTAFLYYSQVHLGSLPNQLLDQQYHFIECMWKLSGTGALWILALISSTYLPTYPQNEYLQTF